MTQVQIQDPFWPYHIEAVINDDGPLYVYRASASDGRPVAIKLLVEDANFVEPASGARQRLLRPVQALRHPNAVPVLHIGEADNGSFFVQPWLPGGSLADRRRPRQPMIDDLVPMLERISPALEAGYDMGMVHKWVRPQNLLYDAAGQAFLSDTGFADLYFLIHNAYPYFPPYSAPEIAQSRQIERSADVYSLGAISAEMLTGRQLQSSDLDPQALNLRGLSPDLYELVQPVLSRALAERPGERYPSSKDFLGEISQAIGTWQARREADASFVQQNFATQGSLPNSAQAAQTEAAPPDEAARELGNQVFRRHDKLMKSLLSDRSAMPEPIYNKLRDTLDIASASLANNDPHTADTFMTVAEQDWSRWQERRPDWLRWMALFNEERQRIIDLPADERTRQPALDAMDRLAAGIADFDRPDDFQEALERLLQTLRSYQDLGGRIRSLRQAGGDAHLLAEMEAQLDKPDLSGPEALTSLSSRVEALESRRLSERSAARPSEGPPGSEKSEFAPPAEIGSRVEPEGRPRRKTGGPTAKTRTPDWVGEILERRAAIEEVLAGYASLPKDLAGEAQRYLDAVAEQAAAGDETKTRGSLRAAENVIRRWAADPEGWLAVRRQTTELLSAVEEFPDLARRSVRGSLSAQNNQFMSSGAPQDMLKFLEQSSFQIGLYQSALEELDAQDDLARNAQDRQELDHIRQQLTAIRPKDQGKVYAVLDRLEKHRAVLLQPLAGQPSAGAALFAGEPAQSKAAEPGAQEAELQKTGNGRQAGGEAAPQPGIPSVVNLSLPIVYTPPEPPGKNELLRLTVRPEKVELDYEDKHYSGPNLLKEQELLYAEYQGPQVYGETLFRGLIHERTLPNSPDPSTAHGYTQAVEKARGKLALELRAGDFPVTCRWELLKDPAASLPFSVREHAPFFRRYGTRISDPAPADPLRILVVIANPQDLGQTKRPGGEPVLPVVQTLPPIDAVLEASLFLKGKTRLESEGLAEFEFLKGAASLDAIKERLQESVFHVLHILAHGVFIPTQQKHYLVLEDENGFASLTPATDFDATLWDSGVRLVVLSSCQSGNLSIGASNLPALAPGLMQSQLSAVIAMQGDLPAPAAQVFHARFYDDLARTGRIDMALAATRYDLYRLDKEGWSWGLPLLLMNSREGLLFKVNEKRASRVSRPELEELKADEQSGPAGPAPSSTLPALTNALAQQMLQYGLQMDPARIAGLLSGAKPAVAPGEPLALPQDRRSLRRLNQRVALQARPLQQYVRQHSGLELDEHTFDQIASALNTGKHLILIGPPGSGKTSLAQDICRCAREIGFTTGAVLATATADWTTFDTVGGYVPTPDGTLQFRPGIFLEAIRTARWLVIDEINRAEIDKAFGELFTVLSGQQVDLPWMVNGEPVQVVPPVPANARTPGDPDGWMPGGGAYTYGIHPSWRIIGTMNVYDKSSLFQMSFAFMRRFAFIDVDLPNDETYFTLLDHWLKQQRLKPQAGIGPAPGIETALRDLLQRKGMENPLMQRRALGPAIVKDMIEYVGDRYSHAAEAGTPGRPETLLIEAFLLYVVSQLDGLDHDGIHKVYDYLKALFGAIDSGECERILTRIRLLYPHIPLEEWETNPEG